MLLTPLGNLGRDLSQFFERFPILFYIVSNVCVMASTIAALTESIYVVPIVMVFHSGSTLNVRIVLLHEWML